MFNFFCKYDKIKENLISPNRQFVKEVVYFDKINSTNAAGKNSNCTANTLFVAEMQSDGRGRNGRKWISPKGSGVWMSIVTLPKIKVDNVSQITLVAGLAVCESLNNNFGIDAKIKWPNDIVVDGKKLCGILTEAVSENGVTKKVIIGIGINVNNKSFPKEICDVATSLRMLLTKKSDRTEIINNVLDSIEKYYNVLINEGNLEKIIEEYKKLCVNIGKEVVTTGAPEVVEGVAIDITEKGELVIQKKDGNTVAVNSGEVSVRGIYGYI